MFYKSILCYLGLFVALFLFNIMYNHCLEYVIIKINEAFWKATLATNSFIGEDEENITRGLSVFLMEVATIVTTIFFLNKVTVSSKSYNRLDQLIEESKEALRQTHECLEKCQLRKLNNKKVHDYSYLNLDDEPQSIANMKLEVPLIQMAIINSRSTRNQPEGGDAGDTLKITDSTIISLSSLLDEEIESVSDGQLDSFDKAYDEKVFKMKNRHLWDVIEGDNSFHDLRRNA